jgi:hypothetical protein
MSFPTTDALAELPLLPAWLKGRMWLEGGAFSETNQLKETEIIKIALAVVAGL